MATCTCIASQIFCFPLLLMGKLNSVKSFPPPQFSDSFGPHRQKRTRTINHPPFPSPLSFSTLSAASAFSAKIQWLFSSPLYQSKTKVFLFSFFFLNCKGKTKNIKSKETPYTPLSFNASQQCQNLFHSNVIFPHHGKMAMPHYPTVHSTPCNTINADYVQEHLLAPS